MEKPILNQLMDSRIFTPTWDFQIMIGDVKRLLDISEKNLEVLYRNELAEIQSKDYSDIPSGYQHHLESNAEFRFLVTHSLQVRYNALLSMIIAVEWAMLYLNSKLKNKINSEKRKNHTALIIDKINSGLCLGLLDIISIYKSFLIIRNCIVHNSGIKSGFSQESKLVEKVKKIEGISFENKLTIGKHIWIEKNSLNKYIDMLENMVVQLYKSSYSKGLIDKRD